MGSSGKSHIYFKPKFIHFIQDKILVKSIYEKLLKTLKTVETLNDWNSHLMRYKDTEREIRTKGDGGSSNVQLWKDRDPSRQIHGGSEKKIKIEI